MNVTEAMNVLGLSGKATQREVKKAFKSASIKYHPDRNPAGEQMMKAIVSAYESLLAFGGDVEREEGGKEIDFGEELNKVINDVIELANDGFNIIVEVCGNWVWVTGETFPVKDKLGKSGIGMFYAKKKNAWYFRPEEYKSKSRKTISLNAIRKKHGTKSVKENNRKRIA